MEKKNILFPFWSSNIFFLFIEPLEKYFPNVFYKDFWTARFWIFCWILTETIPLYRYLHSTTHFFRWIAFEKYFLAQSSHLNVVFKTSMTKSMFNWPFQKILIITRSSTKLWPPPFYVGSSDKHHQSMSKTAYLVVFSWHDTLYSYAHQHN